MLRLFIVCFFLLTTVLAHASTVVTGDVGVGKHKTTHVEPNAVVMQDENGNDALVVFYRLRQDQQKVGFSIARNVGSYGKLIWDPRDYVLKQDVMNTQGIAPKAVMLDDTLYVFGAKNDERRYSLHYNSFDSLDDLIAHTEGNTGNTPHLSLSTLIDGSDPQLSVSALDNGKLLLAYQPYKHYHKTFLYQTCEPSNGELVCSKEAFSRNYDTFEGNLNLVSLETNGEQQIMMFTARDSSKHLHFYLYDDKLNDFSHRYTFNGRDGNQKLLMSEKPAGTVQAGNTVMVYYKQPHGHALHKTSFDLSSLYKTSGVAWSKPTPIKIKKNDKKNDALLSETGVSAIRFKDRTFVFYGEKDSRLVKYFTE